MARLMASTGIRRIARAGVASGFTTSGARLGGFRRDRANAWIPGFSSYAERTVGCTFLPKSGSCRWR